MTEVDCCDWLAEAPERAGVEEPLEPFCWVTGDRPPVLVAALGGGLAGLRGLCLAGPG